MRSPCKSATEALAESPIAGLLDQARLLGQVAAVLTELGWQQPPNSSPLPPLRCALEGWTVVVTVANPSLAAKLRQRMTALQQTLRERVPEVTGIRVRIQPAGAGAGEPQAGPPALPPLPQGSQAAALRFADDLVEGLPDSPLRRSALRLQATLRSKLPASR